MTFRPGSEDEAQFSIKEWLEWVVPGIEVVHVPNSIFAGVADPDDLDTSGRARRRKEKAHIARLKSLGMRPGALDLICMVPGPIRLFWIECKRPGGGRLEAEQSEFGDRLDRLGIPWGVCRSIADARKLLTEIGVATREAGGT